MYKVGVKLLCKYYAVRKSQADCDGWSNLAADAAVGPANLFLHSLVSQVAMSLNGTLITQSTNTYSKKKSQLTSALFYKDQAGTVDSLEVDDDAAAARNDVW